MLKEDIVDLIAKAPQGLSRGTISEMFPEVAKSTLYTAINKLEKTRVVTQVNGFYFPSKPTVQTTKSLIEGEIANNSHLYDQPSEEAALRFLIQNPEHMSDYVEYVTPKTMYSPQYAQLYEKFFDCYCKHGDLDFQEIIFNADEQDLIGKLRRTQNTVTSYKPLLEGLIAVQKKREMAIELSEALGEYLLKPQQEKLAVSIVSVVEKLRGLNNDKTMAFSFESVERVLGNIRAQQSSEYKTKLVSTGFRQLDRMLGKMRPGQLITIAARPSIGKTTFALDMAQRVAESFANDNKMLYFKSLEMDEDELIVKCISRYSKLSTDEINMGTIGLPGMRRVHEASKKVGDLPIIFDCNPYVKPFILRENLKRLKQKYDIGAVFIDYLQLMEADKDFDTEYNILRDVTRKLKLLAKEMQLPIIVLSQLSREVEKSGQKTQKPRLSDLRGSGTIEQDSDVVIMLHREDFYDEHPNDVSDLEVLVRKVRMGRTGKVDFFFDKVHNTVDEAAVVTLEREGD